MIELFPTVTDSEKDAVACFIARLNELYKMNDEPQAEKELSSFYKSIPPEKEELRNYFDLTFKVWIMLRKNENS